MSHIEEGASELPTHQEWVHKEEVPGKRHCAIVQDVWILKINRRVFDIVTGVKEQFTFSIEFNSL